eukprot:39727-Eustigmatos_ZCMA.PRE.1
MKVEKWPRPRYIFRYFPLVYLGFDHLPSPILPAQNGTRSLGCSRLDEDGLPHATHDPHSKI